MADQATTVLIVDDQMPFRMAARSVVGVTPGFEVVGEAKSGEEAVEQVAALDPELVLMDINMDGIAGSRPPAGSPPSTPGRGSSSCRPTTPRTSPPTPARAARSATSTRSSSVPTSSCDMWSGEPDGLLQRRADRSPRADGCSALEGDAGRRWWCPRPARDAHGDGAADGPHPVAHVHEAGPAGQGCPLASNPAPVSRTSKLRLASSCHTRTKAVAPVAGVLARVLQRLQAAEVDGRLRARASSGRGPRPRPRWAARPAPPPSAAPRRCPGRSAAGG